MKTAANWYGRHLEFVLEGRVWKTQANRPDLLLSNAERKTLVHWLAWACQVTKKRLCRKFWEKKTKLITTPRDGNRKNVKVIKKNLSCYGWSVVKGTQEQIKNISLEIVLTSSATNTLRALSI